MRWVAGVFAISCISCGSDTNHSTDAPGGSTGRLKASFDLTGVMGFAIDDMSNLYAVHDDGSMVAATFTEVPSGATETAAAIYDTPKYVAISYGASDALVGGSTCQFVVIRKSDGALTCAAAGDGAPTRVVGTSDKLFVGLLPTTTNGVARVDMSTTPPTVTNIQTLAGNRVDVVDANGADAALVGGSFGVRIYKADDTEIDVTGNAEKCQWYDAAHDTFYYGISALKTAKQPARTTLYTLDSAYAPAVAGELLSTSTTSPDCRLALVSATASQAFGWTNTPSPSIVELLANGATGQCWHPSAASSGTCSRDTDCNGTCIVSGGGCVGTFCCEGGSHNGESCNGGDSDCVGTCNLSGTQHAITGITSMAGAVGGGNKVYVEALDPSNNGSIILFTTDTFGQVTLIPTGDYSFSAFSVAKNGDLTFTALRSSDSAHVIGICNSTCTVLSATAPPIRALQRIN